jgi:hypothetical protein
MRRWRNQSDARGGMPNLSDPWINFFTGQLATFAGLCTLSHFDLQLFCFY